MTVRVAHPPRERVYEFLLPALLLLVVIGGMDGGE